MVKDRLRRRSFSAVDGPTTIALEPEFFDGIDEICTLEGKTFSNLLREIDSSRIGPGRKRSDTPLAAAARIYVLIYFRRQATLLEGSRADAAPLSKPNPLIVCRSLFGSV